MKYYILDNKAEPVYPQVQCVTLEDAHKFKHGEFPNFIPNLVFRLELRAKFTDILSDASISASGLLINEKAKNIFEKFNLIDHKYFPVTIQGTDDNYYWMQIVSPIQNMKWIDFPNSEFYVTDAGFREDNISLNSFDDYLNKKKKQGVIWGVGIDKILFNKNFNQNLDLYTLPKLDINIYISNNLKKALEDAEITGIEFKKALHIG